MIESIKQRMDGMIMNTTNQNKLFSLIVETATTTFDTDAEMSSDNHYYIRDTDNNLVIGVICNDNNFNTITVNIDRDDNRIAIVEINVFGDIHENYNSIPRALRSTIYVFVDDIANAVDGFINENNIEGESNNE